MTLEERRKKVIKEYDEILEQYKGDAKAIRLIKHSMSDIDYLYNEEKNNPKFDGWTMEKHLEDCKISFELVW